MTPPGPGQGPGPEAGDDVVLRRRDGSSELDFDYRPDAGSGADVVAELADGDRVTAEVGLEPGTWGVAVMGSAGQPPTVTVDGEELVLAAVRDGDPVDQIWAGRYAASSARVVTIGVRANAGRMTLTAVCVTDAAGPDSPAGSVAHFTQRSN